VSGQFFKDASGASWSITLDETALDRIQELAGVNLRWTAQQCRDNPRRGLVKFGALMADTKRVGKIFGAILPDDIAWDGATVMKAARALTLALHDAFPNSHFQEALAAGNRAVMELEAGPFSVN
jgi:hypothetical protein